jgi:putative MATE family efflux protein
MLTSMLQQLFNATDVAVVGRFASKEAMAAVGGNASVVSLLINFFVGLSVGANVVIAKNIGARNPGQARKAVNTSMLMALICGVFIAAAGNLIAGPIVHLMGVPDEVAPYSVLYLRIYFAGAPFILLYNFEAAIFRSSGNTRTPLICLFAGGAFNVAANLVFVLIFKMDVDGVAIATVMANAISSMLMLLKLRKEEGVIRVHVSKLWIDRPVLMQIIRIGLPAGIQSTVFSISNLCVQSAINSLGSDVMAASSAAYNIEIFVFFVVNAFTQTLVTFVGQNYGAGEYRRCREIVRKTLILSWVITLIASVLVILTVNQLMGLFTDDPAIVEIGALRVKVLMYSETLNVFMDNLSGAMRGLGKSMIPAIISLVGVCGTRITWVFTGFQIYHTFFSLMMVFPVSWGVSALVITIMYIKTRNEMLPVD